jgi:trk system potassium uptake protein TrkH
MKRWLSTTQLILLGFLMTILAGALLLMIPAATASGEKTDFLTALFTSTTSVCVTGLVVEVTATHWSLLGHVIILCLIQIGGLGIIAVTMGCMLVMRRQIGLRDRLLLEDAFNLSTASDLVPFLRRVIGGTFFVEGLGAIGYLFVFVPEYGAKGIWYSVFHAVSAFCNAGIDLLGPDSLLPYANNVWMNIVTMLLIVMGGIGFIVWWDILDVIRRARRASYRMNVATHLKLHTKVVLVTTAILLFGGAILFAMIEWNNPETLGTMRAGEKLMAALFQSVTARTAGFCTISQSGLRGASVLTMLVLMTIGGSPGSTAGGVKTATVALLIYAAMCTVKGQEEVVAFHKRISPRSVRKAWTVLSISLMIALVGTALLMQVCDATLEDALYEVFSAVGTVGISRGLTSQLNEAGRVILIICMYLGRIGPISMAIAFSRKKPENSIQYAEGEITVG